MQYMNKLTKTENTKKYTTNHSKTVKQVKTYHDMFNIGTYITTYISPKNHHYSQGLSSTSCIRSYH